MNDLVKDYQDLFVFIVSRLYNFTNDKEFDTNNKNLVFDLMKNRGTIIQKDSIERIKRLKVNEIVLNRYTIFNKKMKINLELKDCIHMIDSLLNDELFNSIWASSDLEWRD